MMKTTSHIFIVLSTVIILIVVFGLVLSQSFAYSIDYYDETKTVASYDFHRVVPFGSKMLNNVFVKLFKVLGNSKMHSERLIATSYSTDYLDWYDEVGFRALWRFSPLGNKYIHWKIFDANDVAAKKTGGTAYNFSFVIQKFGNGRGDNPDFSGIRNAFRFSRISYADYYGYPDLSCFDSVANTSKGSPCICYYLTSRFIYYFDLTDFKYHLYSPAVYVKLTGNRFDTNSVVFVKDDVLYSPFVPTAEIFMKYKMYEDFSAGLRAYFTDEDLLEIYDPTDYFEMTFLPEVYEYHESQILNYIEDDTPVPLPCDHDHNEYLVAKEKYLTDDFYPSVLGK